MNVDTGMPVVSFTDQDEEHCGGVGVGVRGRWGMGILVWVKTIHRA